MVRIGALEQSVLSAQTALEATTLGRDVGSRTELDAAGELDQDDLRALNAYVVK